MTLDELIAREEIHDVLLRYCRSMDRMDLELGYSVFHGDAPADYGPEVYQGTGPGFVDWAYEYHQGFDSTAHRIANSLIEVDRDRAVAETYVSANFLSHRDETVLSRTVFGRYLDTFAKIDGVWAISNRSYVRDFLFQQEVAGGVGTARRNHDDPSYALYSSLTTPA
jgi:hypothetical protein